METSDMTSLDSFRCCKTLQVGSKAYAYYSLPIAERNGLKGISRLPFSMKVLLENLLRNEDGRTVTKDDIKAFAEWLKTKTSEHEFAFRPARVLMQDFTGVPAEVDLAAMRDAMKELGGDPKKINPQVPVDLVIHHSVAVSFFGNNQAFKKNVDEEYRQNQERYKFLKWAQRSFDNFRVVPPGTGICHQVNLEYLAKVVWSHAVGDQALVYPDTLVGTDSHTTMINGLGVLGWGVGGIEAEAAMLGQPVSMLVPQVVGFKLTGKLREGATATDLVLTVTEMLRKLGVVGKFVEFYGSGVSELSLADRATIGNMAPEYGATCGIFPVDAETLRYLQLTGRSAEQIKLVEAYSKEQGWFYTADSPEAEYTQTTQLDLSTVEPSVAGPRRPQDRVALSQTSSSFKQQLPSLLGPSAADRKERQTIRWEGEGGHTWPNGSEKSTPEKGPATTVKERFGVDVDPYLDHGSIVIAAITSCTNTSNPSVMIAAGLLAKKASEKGLRVPPWVKTSLAPGSRVVTDYYQKAGLLESLDKLRFQVVGYGCTTCIGNSGPLPTDVSKSIDDHGLVAVSVLSGNRNFEGRINSEVRANYLMSPPLVVAYALVGNIGHNFETQPMGKDKQGKPVFLKDIWPTQEEVNSTIASAIDTEIFSKEYATVTDGDQNWQNLKFPTGETYQWEPDSTYIRKAPYFDGMPAKPAPGEEIRGARVLAVLGDSVTTDHISPAGSIKRDGPAGKYLVDHGVKPTDFNSYGSRRGNHEVMVRGTFANVRLRNKMVPNLEGGFTRHLPDGAEMSIFEASEKYIAEQVPLIILAGKEYGSGSSRDWAAKGPLLLGVRAVIAESYERIHRSNLVGMGILALQFLEGETAQSLGLTGEEVFEITGIRDLIGSFAPGRQVTVRASAGGKITEFKALVRIDTPQEAQYYANGGILQFVLRQLLSTRPAAVHA